MDPPTYTTKEGLTHFTRRLGFASDYWAFRPTTGFFTRLLGFASDYWAFHPTIGLFTRLLGFAPDYWALHPTIGLCTRRLSFHPNTEFLTQILKSPHSSDQRTFIGHFPLKPGPLLMAYSHMEAGRKWLATTRHDNHNSKSLGPCGHAVARKIHSDGDLWAT